MTEAASLIEQVARQRAAKPELLKQARQRVGKKASEVHAVEHAFSPNLKREAEEANSAEVEMPTAKRFVRASALPGIEPPPGYSVKWVRIHDRNRGDNANLIAHQREGWVIARASMFKKQSLPTARLANHGDVIGNDDTILMIATIELVADRNGAIRKKTDAATRGVHEESGLKGVVTPQMPLVEDVMRSRSALVRHRRKATPAPDAVDDE